MKWRCALIQRRLPDYPDGDLSAFWKRRVASHLEVCPDCRQEATELAEVMSLYQAQPLPDPGPAFWQDFQQELHLKLAQVNQTQTQEPAPWRLRLPHYVVGAAAMAGVLALAIYLGPFSRTSSTPQMAQPQVKAKGPEMALRQEVKQGEKVTAAVPTPPAPAATQPVAAAPAGKPATAAPMMAKPAPAPAEEAEFSLAASKPEAPRKVAGAEEGLLSEDDDLDWDVDSVVADLSKEERQSLKSKLESRR